MEDFQLDLIIGEGPAARSVKIDLAPFTLVGATTRLGLLTTPLRDRFGIPIRLNFYSVEELEYIVRRGARILGLDLTAGRGDRDRPPLARHAAHRRRGCSAGSATSPLVDGVEPVDARHADRRCAGSRSTRSASTSSTGAISS